MCQGCEDFAEFDRAYGEFVAQELPKDVARYSELDELQRHVDLSTSTGCQPTPINWRAMSDEPFDPEAWEHREMRQRFNIIEAMEVLNSMPSTPVEFARWYLSGE